MAVRLSALRAGRYLPPGRFLVLISVRNWVDPRDIVRLEGLGQMEKSNDLIGNRPRDLLACSTVSQPRHVIVPTCEISRTWVRVYRTARCHISGHHNRNKHHYETPDFMKHLFRYWQQLLLTLHEFIIGYDYECSLSGALFNQQFRNSFQRSVLFVVYSMRLSVTQTIGL
jgi:hypothetical protein